MQTDPQNDGAIMIHSNGIGTVTRHLVHERARELAVINGRSPQDVSANDWAQAKRELTGQPEEDPKQTLLEFAPESERWDPLPGSTGSEVLTTPLEGEDDEGRSLGEKLIEEGVQEAEHDQMLEAARDEEKENRRE